MQNRPTFSLWEIEKVESNSTRCKKTSKIHAESESESNFDFDFDGRLDIQFAGHSLFASCVLSIIMEILYLAAWLKLKLKPDRVE